MDKNGDLSDSISVIENRDTYIVESNIRVKNKLTYRARRDRIDEFLYRLTNNPYKKYYRIIIL